MGVLKIWELSDLKEEYRALNTGAPINKVCFNPNKQWIAAACENGVQVFDLMNNSDDAIAKLIVEKPKKKKESKLRADSYQSLFSFYFSLSVMIHAPTLCIFIMHKQLDELSQKRSTKRREGVRKKKNARSCFSSRN